MTNSTGPTVIFKLHCHDPKFLLDIPRQDGSVALAKLKDELGINENDPEKLIEILKSFPAEKLLLVN